jgi:transposase
VLSDWIYSEKDPFCPMRMRNSRPKSVGSVEHATPDHIVDHPVTTCSCGNDLRRQPCIEKIKHQVFDLPILRLEVTEHRCERKFCPACQLVTTAQAPAFAQQPTQYGPRLAGWAVYLTIKHFVPVARTCELIQELTGTRPSHGWVLACQERLSKRLDGFIEGVTDLLRKSPTVCCDETGFRFGGERRWLHVCCTALLTLLMVSRFRGGEATRAMGILGTVRVAMHDNYPSYFTFTACAHGLCNAHHQRELVFIKEEFGQRWAGRMIRVLLDAKVLKERYHPSGRPVPGDQIARISRRYDAALNAGFTVNPPPPSRRPGQRGRIKRGKALCLLDRLRDRIKETLLFLSDPDVPWENNQAERDIRMAKVQQKVSGGFRTEAGAVIFARCRSYLDTMRKQDQNILAGITAAMDGRAWMPIGEQQAKKKQRGTAA